ncbi:unnamed protein product [Rotaria sp. Silwood2]|nr:unnamed protein product [Rotaria sp. Silwood2]
MINEGLRYSLYIPHGVQPEEYTIRVDDDRGQESTCQVTVEDLPENELKKPRSDVEATWLFDGIMFRSNVFTTINFKPNELAQLIMKEVYLEDAGIYKLRLKNKYGKVSITCTVSVCQRESSTDQRKTNVEDLLRK